MLSYLDTMALAAGSAVITDTIYYDRFKHVPELMRLGANIELHENVAVVRGVKKLTGAKVMSTDLRALASWNSRIKTFASVIYISRVRLGRN